MIVQFYETWSLKRLAADKKQIKEVWPGRNRFYCWGRCIAGPWKDCYGQSCVIITMAVILGVYFGVMAVPLATKVTVWLPISFALVAGITIGFYLATHCTDPGFIPRRPFFTSDLVQGRTQAELGQYLSRRMLTNLDDATYNNTSMNIPANNADQTAIQQPSILDIIRPPHPSC
jgi:hypothetical protein